MRPGEMERRPPPGLERLRELQRELPGERAAVDLGRAVRPVAATR